jgi:hypothetical protein
MALVTLSPRKSSATDPRNRYGNDIGALLPAPRAAHPRREASERHFPSDQASDRLRLNLTADAAFTNHAHEEVAKAIVQPLDVRQHAHGTNCGTTRLTGSS